MTRTSTFDSSSSPNPDPAYQWDTKRILISPAEVCALRNALLVGSVAIVDGVIYSFKRHLFCDLSDVVVVCVPLADRCVHSDLS